MAWDRQIPDLPQAPCPPRWGRWLLAAAVAVLFCVLLMLSQVSQSMPLLVELNPWALCGLPLLLWILAFGARAWAYGNVLSHHRFLQAQAREAQQSWQGWAQRGLAVSASCVLLPDQVSASVLAQGVAGLPPRTGTVRPIAAWPVQMERGQAGLRMLIQAIAPALQRLPLGQALRITLLTDADPGHYCALHDEVQLIWSTTVSQPLPAAVNVTAELSYQWIDELLKTASASLELVLVLQVHGEARYSDGIAALLLCTDSLAQALKLPVSATLHRPMPLNVDSLDSDFSMFLQTQTSACKATGLLADAADWQPRINELQAVGTACGASLKIEHQWIQESLCGLPGPLGHWLVTALGVDMHQHSHEPLLVLAREESQYWMTTMTKGEMA